MNLFEIDEAVRGCVDPETGEIVDPAALDALEMERSRKIRNIACWIKNLRSDAEQLRQQEQAFAARKRAKLNRAESLERYLKAYLNGEPVKDTEYTVSWRNTKGSEVTDFYLLPDKYKIPQEPRVDKMALLADLKEAEKNGCAIPGAELVIGKSMTIK